MSEILKPPQRLDHELAVIHHHRVSVHNKQVRRDVLRAIKAGLEEALTRKFSFGQYDLFNLFDRALSGYR